MVAVLVSTCLAACLLVGTPATARSARVDTVDQRGPADRAFAPVDRPGPALRVPRAALRASLQCTANASRARRNVAIFVPGTTLTPAQFEWNWFRALDALDRPYCAVTLPNNAMTDTQVSAEYVVHAIRHVHRISGRKVTVLGHSQGGTEPRFALRFWPDLRPMVEDYIGFAATNHGSPVINLALCGVPVLGCAEALWQQNAGSDYVAAMNSRQETFRGISYTQVYTRTDEFVQPNLDDTGTSSLRGGGGRISNVAVQDICPTDLATEHIAVGTYSPVAYALAMDAMDHDGPARPARIARSVCLRALMPGVDPLTFAADLAALDALIARQLALAPRVPAEPPLADYVFAR